MRIPIHAHPTHHFLGMHKVKTSSEAVDDGLSHCKSFPRAMQIVWVMMIETKPKLTTK